MRQRTGLESKRSLDGQPSVTRLGDVHARTRRSALPPAPVVRMFLLASVGVVASAWALVRFYTHPRAPMVVPAAVEDAGLPDGELPAPEIVTAP